MGDAINVRVQPPLELNFSQMSRLTVACGRRTSRRPAMASRQTLMASTIFRTSRRNLNISTCKISLIWPSSRFWYSGEGGEQDSAIAIGRLFGLIWAVNRR